MRKLFSLLTASVLFVGAGVALAAAEKTITGDAVCAKCALKEQAKCQNVVMLDEAGKAVKYYLTGPVSQKNHGALGICTASKDAPIKVKVTGEAAEKDGKNVIEVTKIEKAD
jgi:Family of unknown function (DUF6370)